jgi:hypothetical protein
MKNLLILFTFLLLPFFGMSQSNDKTFHLKNGSVITGTVLEEVPGKEYKVKTPDGNIFVFKADEIEKIVLFQEGQDPNPMGVAAVSNGVSFYSFNGVSVGGRFFADEATYNIGLSSINGVRLGRMKVGLGLEYQITANGGYIPIFLDTRFNLSKSSSHLYAFMNAGMAISQYNQKITVVKESGFTYDEIIHYENGFLARAGIGYEVPVSPSFECTISLFYGAQGYSANKWLYVSVYFNAEGVMSRVGLKMGIVL